MEYEFDAIMECVNELGVEETFTPDMLETLLNFKDFSDDKALYSLIILFGDAAFTNEAKEYLNKNKKGLIEK